MDSFKGSTVASSRLARKLLIILDLIQFVYHVDPGVWQCACLIDRNYWLQE
jgi:hypothetical protein